MSEWNPYWLAYCREEGLEPEDARALGFMLWIQAQWREFFAEKGLRRFVDSSHSLHPEFGAWLETRTATADEHGQLTMELAA